MAHASAHDDDAIHGINVTPLVDIMLVLLLIFMITTSITPSLSVNVNLPRAATATEQLVSSLSIVIVKDGTLRLDGRPATLAEIEAQSKLGADDAQAVISADKDVSYDRVIGVIDAVRRGGVHKVALPTELLEESR